MAHITLEAYEIVCRLEYSGNLDDSPMARNKRLPLPCSATNNMSRTLRDQSLYELPEFFDQSVVFALSRASRPGLPVCFLRTLCIRLCSAQRFHPEGGAQTCRVGCPDEPDSFTLQRMSSASQLVCFSMGQATVLPRRGHPFHNSITQVSYEASNMESW